MLCSEDVCFGCSACMNVCPKNAITMRENKFNAFVPYIDNEKCVSCGLCESVCPSINKVPGYSVKECYAAWSNDDEILKTSASAGIVSSVYKWAIENNGVVFGTRYRAGKLVFDYAENKKDIVEFRGSKYIHADIEFSYAKVKEFLKAERLVVFAGTPCQIAGLKLFLRKDYPRLLLVDILCHGVAPQKWLEDYCEDIIHKSYDKVLFRGENGNKIAVYKDNRLEYLKEKQYDGFSMAYAKGLVCRENCYSCPFASLERMGDITAGDFWGLNKKDLKNNAEKIKFISLLLVNTEKGQRIIEELGENLIIENRNLNEAIKGNKQLSVPCEKNSEREKFINDFQYGGFVKALKDTDVYKTSKKNAFIHFCKTPAKAVLKHFGK